MKYCIGLLRARPHIISGRKQKKRIIPVIGRDSVFPFIESLSSPHIFLKRKKKKEIQKDTIYVWPIVRESREHTMTREAPRATKARIKNCRRGVSFVQLP